MELHEEFQSAGKTPGLQVWRIEKMDLAPIPPQLHGDFYTGDSYIVLHTTPAPSYNIHSWLGIKLEILSRHLHNNHPPPPSCFRLCFFMFLHFFSFFA